MDNKEVKPIPGGPVLKEALQGATLGFGEEALAGLRSMIPGQPSYPEVVKAEREELRKFESESPGGATTAQLVVRCCQLWQQWAWQKSPLR